MNACIFITVLSTITPVYGNDRATIINQLGPGDNICVMEIQGNWMATHWSVGNQGHGGWLRDVWVKKTTQPTAPSYREDN